MASQRHNTPAIVAGGAFTAMASLVGWAFLQPGTLGMYRWGYGAPVLALAALGIVPLAVAMAARFTRVRAPKVATVAGTVSIVLSVISVSGALAASAFIFSNAYGTEAAAVRPAMIDPPKGPAPRRAGDGTATLRVAMSSDPHWGREASNAEARSSILRLSQAEFEAGRLDAFFDLGDTVETGMMASGWKDALEDIHRYAPTLPFAALMGNHDALVGGQARWKAAFGSSAWRIDSGPVHFIALDLLWGPEGFGRKDLAWLGAQLSSIPADEWIVVLSHSFFYSSGYIDAETGKPWYDHEAMLREVAPVLAGKADLVVSGHNHYMEWLEADGTAWAVVGAMGGKPDPVPDYVSPRSVWISQGLFGRLVVELVPEGLACEFQDQAGIALFARTIAKGKQ